MKKFYLMQSTNREVAVYSDTALKEVQLTSSTPEYSTMVIVELQYTGVLILSSKLVVYELVEGEVVSVNNTIRNIIKDSINFNRQ